MGTTSLPRIIGQLLAARGEVTLDPWTILIVGQIGATGTAVSGQYYENVQDMTIAEIEALFDADTEITGRILRARAICQGRFPIWAVGLDAAAGTAATLDIVTTGDATEDGTITFKAIDESLYTFTVDVLSGDAAADVAANIKTAIDALERFIATSGAVAVATLPLTANDVGTIANKYTIKVENVPAGLTITAGQFSGGATDPTVTGIFDPVSAQRFHSISWPWESDFSEIETFLENRNVINNAFLHGMAFIGFDDTEANITAKVNGGTPLNSPNLIFMGNRQVSSESVIVTPQDWRCVEFMAIEALRQTDGAPIGNYVTVSASRDIVGNAGLASLAYYNTPMALTGLGDPNSLFDGTEQENLKGDGYTIVGINNSKTSAIMGEVVSTYKFNTIGEPDVSFKYLNYIRTGFLALELFFKTLKSDYSQFRLTDGDLIAGRSMANKEQIEGRYLSIYQILSRPDFVLTQAGSAAEGFFFQQLSVTTDIVNGLVTTSGQLPIVTQLRQINITFQLNFSLGG